MNFKYCGIIIAGLICGSCKKDNKSTFVIANVRSSINQPLNNVTVKLLPNETHGSADYIAVANSGADGKVTFGIDPGKTYYLYHYDVDNRWPDDTGSTFINIGTFTSQQQINNSPGQTPTAKIGDDIHLDINADGIINKYDKVIKVAPSIAGSTVNIDFILNQ